MSQIDDGQSGGFLADLHAARGWAAMAVMAFHLSMTWPNSGSGIFLLGKDLVRYGWSGVDLFFVLSGFVLAAPFLGTGSRGGPAYGRFLLRRWIRLAPPYYAAILITFILLGLWGRALEPAANLPLHVLFAQNLHPATIASIPGPFWTLAIEFQFYLLLPLLIPLFQSKRWVWVLGGLVACTLAYRWLTFAGPDGQWNAWAGLQIFPFLAHFAFGMGAARIWRHKRTYSHAGILSWIALAGLVVAPLILIIPLGDVQQDVFDPRRYLVARPLLGLGFAVFLLLRAMKPKASAEPAPVNRFLGDISYSVYLLHVAVISFFLQTWPTQSTFRWAVPISVTVLVASALFHWAVERPAARASRGLRARGRGGPSPAGPWAAAAKA